MPSCSSLAGQALRFLARANLLAPTPPRPAAPPPRPASLNALDKAAGATATDADGVPPGNTAAGSGHGFARIASWVGSALELRGQVEVAEATNLAMGAAMTAQLREREERLRRRQQHSRQSAVLASLRLEYEKAALGARREREAVEATRQVRHG